MKATNQVSITARLAQDAEVRQFANSTKASFSIAIARTEKRGEETIRSVAFQACELWRKNGSAESFAQLTKGALVEFTGYLKPEQYVDKNGFEHHRIILAVNSFSLVKPEEKAETEEK